MRLPTDVVINNLISLCSLLSFLSPAVADQADDSGDEQRDAGGIENGGRGGEKFIGERDRRVSRDKTI